MSDTHTRNKAALAPLRAAMADFDATAVRAALDALIAPEAVLHMAHPLGDLAGPAALWKTAYAPLFEAMPDLERRDWIVMAGNDGRGSDWVGCGGHYVGTFVAPWLGIPPTGHLAHMRFHEFYRFEDGQVTGLQALWDIPEVMMQAGAWPMAPSLGREFCVPGPMTQDGIVHGPRDAKAAEASLRHVEDMLTHMSRHPAQGGPEVMEMARFWHPRMNWYGPAGIGTGRGIAGFRNWHQIPFLGAMPDRGQDKDGLTSHFFGDGAYAAVTGWPNMRQTVTGDGWMGIAPAGQRVTLRSLDFWRIEAGLIRENWVLVDILDAWRQLGRRRVRAPAGVQQGPRARPHSLSRRRNLMPLPRTPSFRLDGKRALIAGASSGIGRACAVALAEAGARVTLAARRRPALEALRDEMAAEGWQADLLVLDVADVAATEAALAEAAPFDILLNSAGLARHSPALDTAETDFDAVSATNLKGAYFLTRAVARGLVEAGRGGSLINVSSQMAHVGGIDRAVYAATKHAVEGFTKSMAIEWGPLGIRVNTICPTFIVTPLTRQTFERPERRAWVEAKIKLGRVGQVEDIMGAAVFLASDASALVTGSALMVDGGWTAD